MLMPRDILQTRISNFYEKNPFFAKLSKQVCILYCLRRNMVIKEFIFILRLYLSRDNYRRVKKGFSAQ